MAELLQYVPEYEQYKRIADYLRETFPDPPYKTERALDKYLLCDLLEGQPVERLARSLGPYLKMGEDFTNDLALSGLWHDGGYARLLRLTGFHEIDGAVFLAQHGMPDRVVSAVLFHSGAREEAQKRYPQDHPVNQVYKQIGSYRRTLIDHGLAVSDLQTAHDGSKVIPIERRIEEIVARTQNPQTADFLHQQYPDFRRSRNLLLLVGGTPIKNLLGAPR